MKDRTPPKPLPPDPKAGTTAWMSCRAKEGCPGKTVTYVRKFNLPSGGRTIRYRCTTCGGAFHITF